MIGGTVWRAAQERSVSRKCSRALGRVGREKRGNHRYLRLRKYGCGRRRSGGRPAVQDDAGPVVQNRTPAAPDEPRERAAERLLRDAGRRHARPRARDRSARRHEGGILRRSEARHQGLARSQSRRGVSQATDCEQAGGPGDAQPRCCQGPEAGDIFQRVSEGMGAVLVARRPDLGDQPDMLRFLEKGKEIKGIAFPAVATHTPPIRLFEVGKGRAVVIIASWERVPRRGRRPHRQVDRPRDWQGHRSDQ